MRPNPLIPVRSMFKLPVMEEEAGYSYVFYSTKPIIDGASSLDYDFQYHRRCVTMGEVNPFKDLPFDALLVVVTVHGADEVMVYQPRPTSTQ